MTYLKMRDMAPQQFHDIVIKRRDGQMCDAADAAFAEMHEILDDFTKPGIGLVVIVLVGVWFI